MATGRFFGPPSWQASAIVCLPLLCLEPGLAQGQGVDDRYEIIKSALLSMEDSERLTESYGDGQLSPCSGTYMLTDIGNEFGQLGHYPSYVVKLDDNLVQLAVLSQFVKSSLEDGGLAPDYVSGKVAKLEGVGLQVIEDSLATLDFLFLESELYPFLTGLASELNQIAPLADGQWSGEGDCGDGEIVAELRTDPPGGRIWLVSEFDWHVCRLEGKDANDLSSCRWREETGKEFSMVAGNYHVFVQWDDGTQSRSRRSFLDESTGDKTVFLVR